MRPGRKPVILVTGAGGQVGRELMRARWPEGVQVCGYTSAELDITNPEAVNAVIDTLEPQVIINAAAYTAVDQAEDEPEAAEAVNATAVKTLAGAANHAGALLIHLSTDYVFDGTKAGWYSETDAISPAGVYGRTKADGERAAADAIKLITLRTSWVYGALGSNFVTTMLRLAADQEEVGVVADQIGCPTSARDLARAILDLTVATGYGAEPPGHRLYHLAGPDDMNWYEFATIVVGASTIEAPAVFLPITTAEYPTRAQRPANSRLDCSLIDRHFGLVLPPARQSIAEVVAELEYRPDPASIPAVAAPVDASSPPPSP